MCIDLFRFGNRLDILFLLEQIWFKVNPQQPNHLFVTEVYDILLKAPKGSGEMNEVWALFPHNCFNGSIYQVRTPRVIPWEESGEESKEYEKYDWLFNGSPEWSNSENKTGIIRDVPLETQDTFGKPAEPFEGKSLWVKEGEIDFPDIFFSEKNNSLSKEEKEEKDKHLLNCKHLLAEGKVNKTLLRIPFTNTSLKEGESGWLRLVVEPVELDAMPVITVNLPGIPPEKAEKHDYVLHYEQQLEVLCPVVLRDMLYDKLSSGKDEAETMRFFLKGLFESGTSTRLRDHRIAIVLPKLDVDISNAICTKGAYYYGMVNLESTNIAHIWVCGSNRNLEDDLIHNAMRIINRVALFPGPDSRERIVASQLAPSTKYEAFSLLVGLMALSNIGPLKKGAVSDDEKEMGPILELNVNNDYSEDNLPDEDDFNFNALRAKYVKADVSKHDKKLIKEFRDLHPFRILFRIVWALPSDQLKKLIAAVIKLVDV